MPTAVNYSLHFFKMASPREPDSMDYSEIANGSLGKLPTEVSKFLSGSDHTYAAFVNCADKFTMLTKDEMISAFTELLPKYNSKDILKSIREELGKYLTNKFFKFSFEFLHKRNAIKTLAEDVYYLVHSLQNGHLCPDTIILFNYDSSHAPPLGSIPESGIGEIMRTVRELNSAVDKLKTEVKYLKSQISTSSNKSTQLVSEESPRRSAIQRKRSLSSSRSGNRIYSNETQTPSRRARTDSTIYSMGPPAVPVSAVPLTPISSLSQGQNPLPQGSNPVSDGLGKWVNRLSHSDKQSLFKIAGQRKQPAKSQMKKSKPKDIIVGSGNDMGLTGVPKKRFFKVSKVTLNTSSSVMKDHIVSFLKCGVDDVVVESIERDYSSHFSLFKVTVNSNFADGMSNPVNWPDNVEISRYFNKYSVKTNDRKLAANAGSTTNRP